MNVLHFVMAGVVLLAAACAAPETEGEPGAAGRIVVDGEALVDADGIVHNSVQDKLNADEALCRSHGGAFQRVCMMGNTMCVVQFGDAGAACTDGSQCRSGRCYGDGAAAIGATASGVCAPSNNPCGCFQRISDGKAEPALCVD